MINNFDLDLPRVKTVAVPVSPEREQLISSPHQPCLAHQLIGHFSYLPFHHKFFLFICSPTYLNPSLFPVTLKKPPKPIILIRSKLSSIRPAGYSESVLPCCLILLLLSVSTQRPTLAAGQKIRLYQNPRHMAKQVDHPFSILVSPDTVFNVQFWFRTDKMTHPELENLLGFAFKSNIDRGFRLVLNFDHFSPIPSSGLTTHVIDHALKSPNLSYWSFMILEPGFDPEPGNALDLHLSVFLNSLGDPVIVDSIRLPDTLPNERFFLLIGSTSPFDSLCLK